MRSRTRSRTRPKATEAGATVLCIDSNYEQITQAAFGYRKRKVYPYLQQKGFSLALCHGNLANQNTVFIEAKKSSVVYLTGVGHGTPDTYKGYLEKPIFRVGSYNKGIPRKKIVHFLSCQTAKQLGPNFVKNGCRAYFGYEENFTFPMDSPDAFLECDSAVDRGFADGLTASQVYDRTKSLFDKHVARLRKTGQDYYAGMLEFNRDHFRCPSSGSRWGKLNARLS